MKAVILAAGVDRRIDHLTRDLPKCLLEIGSRTLLSHQVEVLRRCDVNDITVVVGYGAERVRASAGDDVGFVVNGRYLETNSIYSLWLARAGAEGGFVLLNGDVLFYRAILERLLSSPHPDAVAVDLGAHVGVEEMKVRLDGDQVVEISKEIDVERAHGESVGLLKWSAEGTAALFETLGELVGRGAVKAPAPYAFQSMLERRPLHAVPTDGLPWIEIDFEEDLFLAREAILEKIRRLEAARGR
jgi:choline kinase